MSAADIEELAGQLGRLRAGAEADQAVATLTAKARKQ